MNTRSYRTFRQGFLASLVALQGLALAGGSTPAGAQAQPRVGEPVTPLVRDIDLRSVVVRAEAWAAGEPVRITEDLKETESPLPLLGAAESGSPAGTAPSRATRIRALAPTPLVSVPGIPATGFLPPDPVGDVGPRHYIQAVNVAFSIYDKLGNVLVGPTPINSLWAGFGGPCDVQNNGDPMVRYDPLADRWVISQFALPGHQCFAVSRTSDPVAGGWYLYAFPTPAFPDYPKIGVWPDGYYMGTQRGFPGGGLDVYAFERANMLNGLPALSVSIFVPAPSLFLLPSDLDGPAPPIGTPNFFLRQIDGNVFGGLDRLEVFAFKVNWGSPLLSTFTGPVSLPTDPFDSVLCGGGLIGACIPQPPPGPKLESLTVWAMQPLHYRNFGSHETLTVNHTVDVGGDHAGVRWYELRRPPAGAWSIFQQGTHAPDAEHRWMGSVAMNKAGALAVGYSVSSSTVFPGIRYAGREAFDLPGTLSLGETTLVAGGGSQTHFSTRWGNYSSMDVDPVDDCTFWYTAEYYTATSVAGWATQIGAFKLADCAAPTPPTLAPSHQVGLAVGGLLTDNALPLNAGGEIGFSYRRARFLPDWSWEYETGIVFTGDGIDDGLLADLQFNIVRHLNGPPAKVQPFLLAGLGLAHYDSLSVSDTALQAALGVGVDYRWTTTAGFRLDLRLIGWNDLLASGWTTNVEVLWGPTFSF